MEIEMDVEEGYDPYAHVEPTQENDGGWVKYQEAADEIERLRSALSRIARNTIMSNASGTEYNAGMAYAADYLAAVARSALEPK